jgi:hypothetical protein
MMMMMFDDDDDDDSEPIWPTWAVEVMMWAGTVSGEGK